MVMGLDNLPAIWRGEVGEAVVAQHTADFAKMLYLGASVPDMLQYMIADHYVEPGVVERKNRSLYQHESISVQDFALIDDINGIDFAIKIGLHSEVLGNGTRPGSNFEQPNRPCVRGRQFQKTSDLFSLGQTPLWLERSMRFPLCRILHGSGQLGLSDSSIHEGRDLLGDQSYEENDN